MDDVWYHLLSSFNGFVSNLALLTEIWYLAHFFLLVNFHNQLNCHKTCNLFDLCDVWLQSVDIPQSVW